MEAPQRSPTSPPESPADVYSRSDDDAGTRESVPAVEILELLGDEYTRVVLEAVVEKPRTGREIIERLDVSKPTVYRRLDTLQNAGFVRTETQLDPDGHHRKQFYAVIDQLNVEFSPDGISATLDKDSDGTFQISGQTASGHSLPADD